MASQALRERDHRHDRLTDSSPARDLGPRGSRAPLGHADPAGDPGAGAREILAAIPRWWAELADIYGLSDRWLSPERAFDGLPAAPAIDGADLAGTLPEDLGALYSGALSDETRSRHGRHYTPPDLARALWASATGSSAGPRNHCVPLPGLVRDPACGAGALLLPPLRQHLASLSEADPRITLAGLPRFIEGIDTDPAAVWIANVVLASELLPLLARIEPSRRRPLPRLARVGDGLSAELGPARVVVMNPPYGRVRLDEEERTRWSRYLYGHANLYSMFLGAGLESLDHEGALAAVVPTSFLAGRYFSSLRYELAKNAPLRSLTFVEDRSGVFAGVLQETCLAVFARTRSRRTSISSANGRVSPVAKVSSPRGEKPWILPRRTDDAHVAAAAATMPQRLGAAGWKVSTGPLVWNRRRSDLSSRRKGSSAPVIWAADLDGGQLHRDAAREALRWIDLSERDEDFLVLHEPAILVQRTTSPEQGRRLVCVELTPKLLIQWGGRVVVENHVNVIRPRLGTKQGCSLETLAALLTTRTFDRLVRCIAGSVAVSAYELEALPLPDATTLSGWDSLRGEKLESAVANVYAPNR